MPIISGDNDISCTEMSFEFRDKNKAADLYLFAKFIDELSELMNKYNITSIDARNQTKEDMSKSE